MKIRTIKIVASVMLMAAVSVPAHADDTFTGRNNALEKASSLKQENILLIVKGTHEEIKKFNGEGKRYGSETRLRINFTHPSRIGFLVWNDRAKGSQQWIKLSSGKVRRLASSDKGSPWMNSHFYNEDIGDFSLDDFSHRKTGEKTIDGTLCEIIEALKNKGASVYSKKIFYVEKDRRLIKSIDFFEKGVHTKTLYLEKYEKIQDIWTPRKVSMVRTDGRGKSVLYVKSIEYNVPVSDASLTREGF